MRVNYAPSKSEKMVPKWHLVFPKESVNFQHNIVYVVTMKVCQFDGSFLSHQTGFARVKK